MILFFDTETSGLWRNDLAADDQSQPHLVQLAACLDDGKRKEAASMAMLIKPSGWIMEAEAHEIHGISETRCHRYGVDLRDALRLFKTLSLSAETIVAHGIDFDAMVIQTQLHKLGVESLWWEKMKRRFFCTKLRGADILKREGQYGGSYQWQSLKTCHEEIVGEPFNQTHDAAEDTKALKRVYYAMIDQHGEADGE